MLQKLIVGTAAIAAGMVSFGGIASASDAGSVSDDRDEVTQVGLVNVNNVHVLNNVNVVGGLCELNAGVLGVQVSAEEVANGVVAPVASPGSSDAIGVKPMNCASGTLTIGGTVQDN
ncbi:hypothetical protein [Actinophytocola sediminis]